MGSIQEWVPLMTAVSSTAFSLSLRWLVPKWKWPEDTPFSPVLSCCSGCVECISNKKLAVTVGSRELWHMFGFQVIAFLALCHTNCFGLVCYLWGWCRSDLLFFFNVRPRQVDMSKILTQRGAMRVAIGGIPRWYCWKLQFSVRKVAKGEK